MEVSGSKGFNGLEHPRVLRDYMPCAHELLAREALQVFLPGVAQLFDTQLSSGALAGRAAVVVAGIGEAPLYPGVADQEGEVGPFQIERNVLSLEGAAVHEQGRSLLAEQRCVLVHDPALN